MQARKGLVYVIGGRAGTAFLMHDVRKRLLADAKRCRIKP
jgi:hypothetical protein